MKNILILLFITYSISSISQNKEFINNVTTFYYKNKIISKELWYGDDKKIDSLKTYYPNGNKNEQFYYRKGRYQGESYQYNIKGEKIVTWFFKKDRLVKRIDHNLDAHKNNEERIIKAHEALKKAKRKLIQKPSSFIALYNQTYARYSLGNTTLALAGFKNLEKRVHELNVPVKKEASIYDALASIYAGYEMFDKTIEYQYKAIKTAPNQSRLYYNLGGYLTKIKSYHLAITYYNIAIELVPNHSFANWGLAIVYTDLEQYDKGMECINIAFKNKESIHKLNSGKEERDLNTTRGYLYYKLGDIDNAILDLNEALNLNKNNTHALRYLGEIYYDLKQYKKSCQVLQKAKKLGYEKIHNKTDLDFYLNNSCDKVTSKNPLNHNNLP